MGKQRQSWNAETKLLIVLRALQNDTSITELSREYGVNENVIYRWKSQFLEHGKQAFHQSSNRSPDATLKAMNERLKKLLGEKTLEVDILKSSPASEYDRCRNGLRELPAPHQPQGLLPLTELSWV